MTDIHLESYEVAKIRSAMNWLIGYSESTGIASGVKRRIDEILEVIERAEKRGPHCDCQKSQEGKVSK